MLAHFSNVVHLNNVGASLTWLHIQCQQIPHISGADQIPSFSCLSIILSIGLLPTVD